MGAMDSYGDVPILDRLLEEDEAIDRSPRATWPDL